MIERLRELRNGDNIYYFNYRIDTLPISITTGIVQNYIPYYKNGYILLYVRDAKSLKENRYAMFNYDVFRVHLTDKYHISTPIFKSRDEIIDYALNELQKTVIDIESLRTNEQA